MAKRPGAVAAAGPQTLVVKCKADNDELGLMTLVGEYVESGKNHGRKTFKRKPQPDDEDDTTVFLYFWDQRDGADFGGWWFGESVGGAQVWSRCEKTDQDPPTTGWRVPWDGKVQPDLVLEPKKAQPMAPTTPAPAKAKAKAADAARPAGAAKAAEASKVVDLSAQVDAADASAVETDERVERATDRIMVAEIEANQALESARAMMEGEVSEDSLKIVEELLQAQQTAMLDQQKKVAADIMEARRSAPKTVVALNGLTARVRTVQQSLAQQVRQAKQLFVKKKQEAEEQKQRARAEEQQMKNEQRDAKLLELALPDAMEVVTTAEDMLDMVVTTASPLSMDTSDKINESALATIKDTEKAVAKASESIKTARIKLAQKITAAKQFAPEAKKVALTEYTALQEKVNDAQKKLAPFMRIRKDHEEKLGAKKVMNEVANKLGAVEVEVEKVTMLLTGTQASEEDIKAAEVALPPVATSLQGALRLLEQRLQNAQGALKEDLVQMQERGKESKTKLDAFKAQLKEQLERLQAEALLKQGQEKTQAAEEALAQTTDAEAPFLKGVEVLPGVEASQAIAACKDAAKAADAKVYAAKSFIKSKIVEVKRLPEQSRATVTDELAQLATRVEAAAQKLTTFKRETAQRETSLLLQEVAQKVSDAEAKVQKTAELSLPLQAEKLEEVSVDKLKEASAQTLEAEKGAAIAFADARKMLMAKQKDDQVKDAPGYAAELAKLEARLTAAQKELSKLRKVAVQGEKLWKSQQILQEKEEQMKQVEADVEKAELLTTPIGDERPSNESILEMDAAVGKVQQTLTDVVKSLEVAQQSAQGSLKAQLVALLARTKSSQAKLDEMKAMTREQSERVKMELIVKEAKAKVDKVDASFEQVAEAEAPYLKGMEILPVDEANKAVADSLAAAQAVQQVIAEARTFISSKSLEVKTLLEAVAKAGMEELEALKKRNEEALEKLSQFKKETAGRKKVALHQEALSKVAAVEEAVKRTVEAAAPLASSNDEVSPDAATAIVEKLGAAEQEATQKLDEARQFVNLRQRDRTCPMDPQELAQLKDRLNTVQVDLAKAKSAASEHEQRFVSKLLLQEASDLLEGLEADLEKCTEAAAPLVVEGGRSFIVASMTRLIVESLGEHCQRQQITREDLFAQIAGTAPAPKAAAEAKPAEAEAKAPEGGAAEAGEAKAGAADGKAPAAEAAEANGPKAPEASEPTEIKATEAEFVAFLEKVPELCSRHDLAFSAEQRAAIFELIDTDRDGAITKADFLELFRERYICIQQISLTDSFDIAESKTLDKVQVDDVVEALGEPKMLEPLGVMRVQVKSVKDGTSGWATTQGNHGTTYFRPFTAYAAFVQDLDKTVAATAAKAQKASSFVNTKANDLRDVREGPLLQAKMELMKIRPKINVLRTKLDQLGKKVEEGKRAHSKREEFERRKQEEKKERKAASLILKAVAEKVEKAQELLQKLEEAAAPLTSVAEAELASVGAPLTASANTEAAAKEMAAALAEARECLATHEGKMAKASKGPWFEAKQELAKLQGQLDAAEGKASAAAEGAQAACEALTTAKLGQVSAALRSAVKARETSAEALFAEVAGEGKEQISEASLCSHLDKLPDLGLTSEQKLLIFRKVGAGSSISRRAFCELVDRYLRCVKSVAITSEFEIKSSSTLRKLEVDEFAELLEGPQTDSVGLERMRAKALSDGTVGWVTVKGNQGTPFLQDCPRPCYCCLEALSMSDGFPSEGGAEIRGLRAGEVVELLEGPRKEVPNNAMRARCKAVSDGATGWFTVKTKQGQECAKQGKSTFTCKSSIALTNDKNIKECKVLRKLDKGEVLLVLEGPMDDEVAGVTRIKAKAKKDDAEGWVTTKGNAGSIYVEETGRTFVMTASTPLQEAFQTGAGAEVRTLAEGETVELLEGPTEEKSEELARARCRAVADGKAGWITLREGRTRLWSPSYRCVSATAIGDALEAAKAQKLRSLEPGEAVELLEGPRGEAEAGSGALRLKGRAAKDGAVGWMTVMDGQGTPFLESVAPP